MLKTIVLSFLTIALVFSSAVFGQVIQDPNLAYDKDIIYVNTREENKHMLVDNDITTVWSGKGQPEFTIDLGEEVEFDFVGYKNYKGRWHSYAVIDTVSGDTIVNRTTNQMVSNTFVEELLADTLDTPATARFLKVVINNGKSSWRGCGEFILKKLNGVYNAPLLKGMALVGEGMPKIKLEWQLLDETTVDNFSVYKQDGTLLGTVDGTTTEYEVTGIAPNTAYTFYVEATVGANVVRGDNATITTLQRLTDLTGSALSANSVKLEWKDNAIDELGVEIWISEDKENFESVAQVSETTSYVANDLSANTTYFFLAAPLIGAGHGKYSDTLEIKTKLGVTGLVAWRYSTEHLQLSFADNGETNSGLYVLSSMDEVAWDTLDVANKADTVLVDTVLIGDLMPNTTYSVKVIPYDEERVWDESEIAHATTYPLRMAEEMLGLLVDEDFTDGSFENPSWWHKTETIGKVDFMAPNGRDFDYGLARKISGEGSTWSPYMWGNWDDRNGNGDIEPGEFLSYKFKKNEDVLVFKYNHFGDLASGSTEYYKVQANIMGPDVEMEVGSPYNTKSGMWGKRQLKIWNNVNQVGIDPPASKWLYPEDLNLANFEGEDGAHTDSTLMRDFQNLVIFRPDSGEVNVETWGNNRNGDVVSPAEFSGNDESDWITIDHINLFIHRPAFRNGNTYKPGVSPNDAQIGLKHLALGITKPSDANLDFVTDVEDFFTMASGWGEADTLLIPTGNPRDPYDEIIKPKTMLAGDMDNNGMVDEADYEVLKKYWEHGEKQDILRYPYDTPKERVKDHRLVAEINTQTGDVSLRGLLNTKVYAYKLVSPSGAFSYGPSKKFLKGLKTVCATEISECNITPKEFLSGRESIHVYALGKMYNTDINPRDVVLYYQDELGGPTKMGGVTYIDMPFDGVFSSYTSAAPPDTLDDMLFAWYAGEKDRRDFYWESDPGSGRDLGQQFVVESNTVLEEITVALFPGGWTNTPKALNSAEGDGLYLSLVKCADKNPKNVTETIATYYGNLPTEMDTTDNRLITFRLPTELDEGALALEPLEGDSTYGFMFGFISPKTGRKINFSITHPNKDTLEVAPDYLGGDKIDFSWKQARDVDGGYKWNPQGWKWAHQLTFWIKASEIGGTVPVEKNPVADMPTKYELAQNYPNPFNPSTTITFSLPNPSEVRLTIFDITGRIVKELVDKRCETGVHNITWDATDNYGMPVASGTYYYRFEADDHVYTKKMMFIK